MMHWDIEIRDDGTIACAPWRYWSEQGVYIPAYLQLKVYYIGHKFKPSEFVIF